MSQMPPQKPWRSRQDYGTPLELLNAIRTRLCIDNFSWDLAASIENAVCPDFYSEKEDALIQPWDHKPGTWLWCNPPFAHIEPWVAKAAREANKGAQTVMLVPASFSNWWREWVIKYAYQVFLNGRITFVGETICYPKDCALLFYTPWRMLGNEMWTWK